MIDIANKIGGWLYIVGWLCILGPCAIIIYWVTQGAFYSLFKEITSPFDLPPLIIAAQLIFFGFLDCTLSLFFLKLIKKLKDEETIANPHLCKNLKLVVDASTSWTKTCGFFAVLIGVIIPFQEFVLLPLLLLGILYLMAGYVIAKTKNTPH